MTFQDYITSLPKKERPLVKEKVSELTGASISCVKHWANGTRKPSKKYWGDLEKAIGINRQQLRPDIFGQ